MGTLIANRSFVYKGTAEDIKAWLQDNDYALEDILGENDVPVVFVIVGTGIKVGYDLPVHKYGRARPMVHLLNGPTFAENNPEAAQRGITLYQKLYNKFRERKPKAS